MTTSGLWTVFEKEQPHISHCQYLGMEETGKRCATSGSSNFRFWIRHHTSRNQAGGEGAVMHPLTHPAMLKAERGRCAHYNWAVVDGIPRLRPRLLWICASEVNLQRSQKVEGSSGLDQKEKTHISRNVYLSSYLIPTDLEVI